VRLPVHMVEKINKVKRIRRDLVQEYGRQPTTDELAHTLDIETDELESILRASRRTVSLNIAVGKEEDTELIQLIEDSESISLDERIDRQHMCQEVNEILSKHLSSRERDIISLRFGLVDGKQRTLDEVGSIFDLSRERIRQIQAKAFRKLRRVRQHHHLHDWLQSM